MWVNIGYAEAMYSLHEGVLLWPEMPASWLVQAQTRLWWSVVCRWVTSLLRHFLVCGCRRSNCVETAILWLKVYTLLSKKELSETESHRFSIELHRLLTELQRFFTGLFSNKFAIKWSLYTVGHKKRATLFLYTSCTNGNRNGYSTEELQNLQLYPNCVSTLPDKTKTT